MDDKLDLATLKATLKRATAPRRDGTYPNAYTGRDAAIYAVLNAAPALIEATEERDRQQAEIERQREALLGISELLFEFVPLSEYARATEAYKEVIARFEVAALEGRSDVQDGEAMGKVTADQVHWFPSANVSATSATPRKRPTRKELVKAIEDAVNAWGNYSRLSDEVPDVVEPLWDRVHREMGILEDVLWRARA